MKSRISPLLAVAIGLAAIGFVLYLLFGEELGRHVLPGLASRSTSMELIDIDWQGKNGGRLHFKIPRAYITSMFKEDGDTTLSDIVIETGLPDLKPRPAVAMSRAELGSPEWEQHQKFVNEGVWVNLRKDWANIPIAESKQRVRQSLEYKLQHRDLYVLPSEHGLLHYFHMVCGPFVEGTSKSPDDRAPGECRSYGHEIFLSPDDGKDWVYMDCASPAMGPAGGCNITRAFDEHFHYLYLVRYSEWLRWKEFDQGVHRLFGSFAIKD